jgi:hypothetical protein
MERRTFLGVIAGGLLAAPLAAKAPAGGQGVPYWISIYRFRTFSTRVV